MSACGGGQSRGTALELPNEGEGKKAMETLSAALEKPPWDPAPSVAVGVFGDKMLAGVSLSGGAAWTFEHGIGCRPVIAGDTVVSVGRDEIFAVNANDGSLKWTRKMQGCLRGAGRIWSLTAVSVRPLTSVGGLVLVVDDAGLVVRQVEDTAGMGVPALAFGYLLLPWRGDRLLAYDVLEGEVVGLARMPHPTTRVVLHGAKLYAGDQAIVGIGPGVDVSRPGEWRALPTRPLPGAPIWGDLDLDPAPPRVLPSDMERFVIHPGSLFGAPDAPATIAYLFHRVVVGLDAKTGATRWTRLHDTDFIGGGAYSGGFALCDREGHITFFRGSDGSIEGSTWLGRPVDACVVQAADFAPPETGQRETTPRPVLARQIEEVLSSDRAELWPLKELLKRDLPVSAR